MEKFNNKLENLKQFLNLQSRQNRLFGAGISYGSKIPLMYPLTDRVEKIVEDIAGDEENSILASLKADLCNQKEQVITELHNRWNDPDSEIVKRVNRFFEKFPEILKPILEG